MQKSTNRILTTHTGSLPRPDDLIPLLFQPPTERFYAAVREAVAEVVRLQVEAGIDVISDGEQSRTGFHLYATSRLGGFALHTGPNSWMPRDIADHPALQRKLFGSGVAEQVPIAVCE